MHPYARSPISVDATSSSTKRRRDAKPAACPVCGKMFNRESDMHRHRETHGKAGKWKCPYCPHRTHQKSNMQAHINTHSGRRPCRCPHEWVDEDGVHSQCAARFADSACLHKHRHKKHDWSTENRNPPAKPRSAARQVQDHLEYDYAENHNCSIVVAREKLREMREAMESGGSPSSTSSSSASPPFIDWSQAKPIYDPLPESTSDESQPSPIATPVLADPSPVAVPADATRMRSDPTDFDLSLESALQAAYAASIGSPQERPQPQNFVDVVHQAEHLLPSQIPTQFFDAPLDFSFAAPLDFSFATPAPSLPNMNWGLDDWSSAFRDTPLSSGADFGEALRYLGADMSMGMRDDACGPSGFDSPPFDVPIPFFSQQTMGLDGLFTAPSSPSSSMTASPSSDARLLDDMLRFNA
ncbi:hypothetical protein C8Q77DRAFT_1156663 [Trametes polyzona]|nr:hypothetical protein C8Q77DRAFT_1156663 [Trametes polyzona]